MNDLKNDLKKEAEKKHGKIYPSGDKRNLDDCFTENDDTLMFWFNLENQSTKVLTRKIDN